VKKLIIFILALTFLSSRTAFNQEAFKLTLKQLPPLTITISEAINTTAGEVVNLDTLFHVVGGVSFYRVWKFRHGLLLQTVDNPVFKVTSDGVFYLTVINGSGCSVLDSIALNIVTGIKDIPPDMDNRQSIHVYPNPNTGTFDITISDCKPGSSVEIINSLGVKLLNKTLDCNYNEYSGRIVMPAGESGTYYLIVKTGNKIIYRQKVIIFK
jgi:hypothetical protein